MIQYNFQTRKLASEQSLKSAKLKIENARRNFIPRNEGFVCEQCGATVGPAPATFRNHCPICLASKHVDGAVPGDRTSPCRGLMPAIGYEGTDPDKLDLIHRCAACRKIVRNRTAPDDHVQQLYA